jgi:hypothetical protein
MVAVNRRDRSDRSDRRLRFVAAFAVAVLLHALLALVISKLPRPAREQRATAPSRVLSVELRELPRAGAESRPGTKHATAAPAHAESRPAPLPAVAKKGPDGARTSGKPLAGAEDAVHARPGSPGGPEEAVLGKPGEKPRWAPGWGLSLTLRDPGATLGGSSPAPDPLPGPVHVPSRAEALAEEQGRVQARVESWLQEDAARLRVKDAREGYWQMLQDKLEHGFKVEWSIIDKDSRRPSLANMVGTAAQEWQRAAAAYGKGGNPSGGADAEGARKPLGEELPQLPAAERGFRADSPLANPLNPQVMVLGGSSGGAGVMRLTAQVLIAQGDDGSVIDVELRVQSGNSFYDRLALERARALGKDGTLGRPPHGHRRSLWSFETNFTQIPPFPIAACALDELLIPRECSYPLKKTVKSRLRLEALY